MHRDAVLYFLRIGTPDKTGLGRFQEVLTEPGENRNAVLGDNMVSSCFDFFWSDFSGNNQRVNATTLVTSSVV